MKFLDRADHQLHVGFGDLDDSGVDQGQGREEHEENCYQLHYFCYYYKNKDN